MSVFVPRRGGVPSLGKMLGDYAEGDIVLLNESGSPVEFYVAKHDYEAELNGAGRTLLVRKDGYDKRQWHNSGVNAYATSDIDAWLNEDYKSLLDESVQTAIGTTKFYYTPGNGNTTVATLARSAFLLSYTEIGKSGIGGITSSGYNDEGVVLPISQLVSDSSVDIWTRTPLKSSTTNAIVDFAIGYLMDTGGVGCTYNAFSRPCFTLPATAKFDPNTNQFISA